MQDLEAGLEFQPRITDCHIRNGARVSVLTEAIQSLSPSAEIELFDLDTTYLGGSVLHFHAGTNALGGPVVFAGVTHDPFPIEVTGFESTGSGALPRPKMSVSNVNGVIGALMRATGDLVGATLTRKRTLAQFLDAVNFPGGVNPTADPNAKWPPDVFVVDRKAQEDKNIIVFELCAAMDMQGFQLPARQILPVCAWVYRSAECSYTGAAVAKSDDSLTTDIGLDMCGGRLCSCMLRFPLGVSPTVPFGGFPGANAMRGIS